MGAMSSITNPVGPEDPRIYWVRRGIVLLVALVVVALLLWIFLPRNGAEPTVATVPSPTTSARSTPTPSADSTPTPTAEPTPEPTESTPASPEPEPEPSESADPTPEPTPTEPAVPAACKPEEVRVTLTGPPGFKAAEVVTFELSIINGAKEPCVLAVNADNLELKVFSGNDRIWTTDHCSDWVPTLEAELAPEEANTWSMAWPAKRSAPDCKIRDDAQPRPGTYVATAQFTGADPVQHVMHLR